MPYSLPPNADERPIAIVGAGTLGQRIAAVYAAGGSEVRIFDSSPDQRDAATTFFSRHADEIKEVLDLDPSRVGNIEPTEDLESAALGWWSKPCPRSSSSSGQYSLSWTGSRGLTRSSRVTPHRCRPVS